MKIYLVRHATASNPEIDIKRPLTAAGEQEAIQIADYLKSLSAHVGHIYHSGVLRAEQTAKIIAAAMIPQSELQVMNELNAPDAASAIAEQIYYCNEDIVLVGHIPLLPRLLSLLILQNENNWVVYFQQPATVVCLERLPNHQWSLDWLVYPGILPR